MRKIFLNIFIVLAFLTPFLVALNTAPQVVHAGITDTSDGCPVGRVPFKDDCIDAKQKAQAENAAAKTVTGWIADAATILPGYLAAYVVLPLVGWLTTLSALLLNYSVGFTIVHMAGNLSMPVIDQVWGAIRDIANMFFIFILLYQAILTMFGKGNYQKTITNMVIAAVLVNFSLFFTKVIIDAGNLLALTVYRAIVVAPDSGSWTNVLDTGLANALMDQLHISSIWQHTGLFDGRTLVTIGVMGSIVALIAAFIFFAMAIMFIVRFLVVIVLMVLSPLMVVGSILPNVGKYAKEWWSNLWGQTFFPAVFFLMIWVSVKFSRSMYELLPGDGKSNFGDALAGTFDQSGHFTGTAGSFAILLNYGLLIGLLILSMTIAKNIATKGGGVVSDLTKKVTGFAGGSTLGMAGRFGRTTFGRAGAGLAESEMVKNAIARGGAAGAAGRLAMLAGNKAAKSSFDIRGTALGGTLGAGKTKKGTSFENTVKEIKKREEGMAKQLKSVKGSERASFIEDEKKATVEKIFGDIKPKNIENEIAKNDKRLRTKERELEEAEKIASDTARPEAERKAANTTAERLEKEIRAINEYREARNQNNALKQKGKERVEKYATNMETPNRIAGIPMPDTTRVLFMGKLAREHGEAALAIRKSLKSKPKEKEIFDKLRESIEEEKEETPTEEARPSPEGGAENKASEGGAPPAA